MEHNLLISYRWGEFSQAKSEILSILAKFGDNNAAVEPTIAKGICKVKTELSNRKVISKIKEGLKKDELELNFSQKWVPIDYWCESELEKMKEIVDKIKEGIKEDETWAMKVEKRRYTKRHKSEIIEFLAKDVDRKVNLNNPNKIIRVDIIGKETAISLLEPDEIISVKLI